MAFTAGQKLRASELNNLLSPVAWVAPTLNSGFTNLTPLTTYHPFRYRKVGDRVELSGTLGPAAAAGVIVTLPAGFRPLKVIQMSCTSGLTSTVQVDINPDGTLNLRTSASGYVAFSEHSFPTT